MSSSTKDKLVVKPAKSFLIVEIKLISANRIIEKLMKIQKKKNFNSNEDNEGKIKSVNRMLK